MNTLYILPLEKLFGKFDEYKFIFDSEDLTKIKESILSSELSFNNSKYDLLVYPHNENLVKFLSLIFRERDKANDGEDIFKKYRPQRKEILLELLDNYKNDKIFLPPQYIFYAFLLFKYNDKIYNFSKDDIRKLDSIAKYPENLQIDYLKECITMKEEMNEKIIIPNHR